MRTYAIKNRLWIIAAGAVLLLLGGTTRADPPSRVARLGYLSGDVSFSPAGQDDWAQASVNRPMTSGDRLWSDRRSRAELQLGGAMIRMGEETGASILNLDDQGAQVRLTQGRLNVQVRRLDRGQTLEIDTPNLAFTVRAPADYRIEVDPDSDSTTLFVRRGQGEAYGEEAAYVVDAQQGYRFNGNDLADYELLDAPRPDDFDRWSGQRDRRYDNAQSARYVSRDVVGYEDLDEYGSWRRDADYGNVWYPNRVSSGWTPYSAGHWAWIDPWGWTWIDDAPWGFTVSHYGRWSNFNGAWGWVPGPAETRAYYAPALVGFVGGNNLQLSGSTGREGSVAWFPLGPRELYRPSYRVSRSYFENVNRSNTVVNTTVVNNDYDQVSATKVVYANRQVPGAVVAVPRTAFVQSQPVSRSAIAVPRDAAVAGPVTFVPPVVPTNQSVTGTNAGRRHPPAQAFERAVVARTAPPAPSIGFTPQQRELSGQTGQPLDEATRQQLPRAPSAPAPAVKIVAPAGDVAPTSRPPPVRERGQVRGQSADHQRPDVAPAPVAVLQQPTSLTQSAPNPSVAPSPPEPHGKAEQRGRPDQHGQPLAPPVVVPPVPVVSVAPVTPVKPVTPVAPVTSVAPRAAVAQPPAASPERAPGMSEGKGNGKKTKDGVEVPPDQMPPPDPTTDGPTT